MPDCTHYYGAVLTPVHGVDARLDALEDRLPVNRLPSGFDPALVAPVAAFLTHRECPVSCDIYTVGARHVARFFIDRTKGFFSPALSSDVATLDEIRDETATRPGPRRRDDRAVRHH